MVSFLEDNFLPITTRHVLSVDFYKMYKYYCLSKGKIALPLKLFRSWFKDTSNPYCLMVGRNMYGNIFYVITPLPQFLEELRKNRVEIRGKYPEDKEVLQREFAIVTGQKEGAA